MNQHRKPEYHRYPQRQYIPFRFWRLKALKGKHQLGNTFWEKVKAITSIILAFVAVLSIIASYININIQKQIFITQWENFRKLNRPYICITTCGITTNDPSNPLFRMLYTIKNVGNLPAYKVTVKSIFSPDNNYNFDLHQPNLKNSDRGTYSSIYPQQESQVFVHDPAPINYIQDFIKKINIST